MTNKSRRAVLRVATKRKGGGGAKSTSGSTTSGPRDVGVSAAVFEVEEVDRMENPLHVKSGRGGTVGSSGVSPEGAEI